MNSTLSNTPATPVGKLAPAPQDSYALHVNPEWMKLINLLQMNLHFTRCTGAELETAEGRTILDFLSGNCVHNTGHNHPYIVRQPIQELQSDGPGMLQSNIVESAGARSARNLCVDREHSIEPSALTTKLIGDLSCPSEHTFK
jgi:4-aminobutyrate aminotransferase-like enzyme